MCTLPFVLRCGECLIEQAESYFTLFVYFVLESSGIAIAFESPKMVRPVNTITSSKVGPNSPHAAKKAWNSTLHLEIRNSRSKGL